MSIEALACRVLESTMEYAADAVQMAAQHLCDGAEIFEQQVDSLLDDLDKLETDVDVVGQVTSKTACAVVSLQWR